jgi:hypothetical protein
VYTILLINNIPLTTTSGIWATRRRPAIARPSQRQGNSQRSRQRGRVTCFHGPGNYARMVSLGRLVNDGGGGQGI